MRSKCSSKLGILVPWLIDRVRGYAKKKFITIAGLYQDTVSQ